MTNFQTEYKKLNPAQKQAVDAIDGPVLVLAGPGTGKTQILTMRIANILRKTQMNPYNILCLTYTESASYTMRQRLSNLIGPSAYDVTIQTFHGFANGVIKDFPHTFNSILTEIGEGELIDFRELDDLNRLNIIKNLLESKNWKYLSPLKANLIHLNQISKHIQDFKRENLSPKSILEQTNKQIKNLEVSLADEKLKKTQQAKLKIEIKKCRRTLELVELYEKYQHKLIQEKYYDYEDMISWVVDALKNDEELCLIYQEKYQYILIDEFQDTNSSQLELTNLLTSFYKDNPNLFVVGDPNQSIYRFQGASKYNIDSFTKRYTNVKIINLDVNYRSGQEIIDVAGKLIEQNESITKLTSAKTIPTNAKISEYLHAEQEIYAISLQIKKLIKQKHKASDIAILIRNNNQISNFVTALTAQKIPFQVIKGEKVLTNPFIEKVLLLIENIASPGNKIKFSQLFYYFREYFTLEDAYTIAKSTMASKDIVHLSNDAKNFLQKLTDVSAKISELPIANALITIFKNFDILKNVIKSPDRLEKLNLLKSLYSNAKDQTITLEAWVQKLRQMQEYKLDLKNEPILFGEEDAVVISTVHQAKGKEYQTIFLPQLEQRIWSKINKSIFYIPPFRSDFVENETAEERRLFYVALTRAKANIYLSFPRLENEKEITPSRFIKELPESINIDKVLENENETSSRIIKQISPIPELTFDQIETAWLKDLVSKQPLSSTGFNNYRNCPRNYLFNNILRIPQIKSPSLSYGSAIHFALEKYFQAFQKRAYLPELDELLGYFKQALENEKQLSKVEKEKHLTEGLELLTNYFNLRSSKFQIPIRTEFAFRGIHLDEIPISGKIDKIEWIDPKRKIVRVIDYKTGSAKTKNALLGLTSEKNTDYLYQLKFYQLLSELDHRFYLNWKIGESTLAFLDSGFKFSQESFVFTKSEIEDFKKDIREVWENIQNLKFTHNPKSKYCDFCESIN